MWPDRFVQAITGERGSLRARFVSATTPDVFIMLVSSSNTQFGINVAKRERALNNRHFQVRWQTGNEGFPHLCDRGCAPQLVKNEPHHEQPEQNTDHAVARYRK